ncbi:hypothetical protein MRX96_005456 [Rhipicephalus microplus]
MSSKRPPCRPLKTLLCPNRNKLRPPFNAGAILPSSEVTANQNCVEDSKSTNRSRRSVHYRGPDGGI